MTVHRVVNIVEKGNSMPRSNVNYGSKSSNFSMWNDGPRNYQDSREFHGHDSYPQNDRQYFDDNSYNNNYRRNASPPRNVSKSWYGLKNYICFLFQVLTKLF